MGKYYNEAAIPDSLRRNYDVYDRIQELGIDLGSFEDNVTSLKGAGIAGVVFHSTGIVYLSGAGGGERQMNDDPERVKHGQTSGFGHCRQHACSTALGHILRRRGWRPERRPLHGQSAGDGCFHGCRIQFRTGGRQRLLIPMAVGIWWRNGRLCQRRRGLGRIRRCSRPKRDRRLYRPFLPGAGNHRRNPGSAGPRHNRQPRLGFPTSPVYVGKGQQRTFRITPLPLTCSGGDVSSPGKTSGP